MFTHAARRRRRWRRRRRLAVLAAAAIAVTIAAQHARPHQPHGTAASPARTAAPRAPRTGRVTFGLGFRWLNYHGIALPVSGTAGPHDIHNGLSGGFTDTPPGAVLAAVNIAVRTSAQWGPRIYRPTINHHVVGRAAGTMLAAANRGYAALRAAGQVAGPMAQGQPTGRAYTVEAAYRLIRYTPGSATVAIVSEGPASNGTTVLAATRIHVRWLRGDWRVVAPPNGTWASSATTVASLSGYTSFPSEG